MRILSKEIVTRYVLSYREDGILNIHVADAKWNPRDNKLLFPVIGEMVSFRKVPLMLTYEDFIFPSSEEIAHYAEKKNACPYFKVDAIVANSLSLKILGNFFIELHKPLRPTRLFHNEEEAIKWLRTFV